MGDNGQGDVRAAELVSQDKTVGPMMLRAYIHQVQPLHQTHTAEAQTRCRSCPYINYFITYVDAAVDAYNHGLIRLSGLQRVAQEAVIDFDRIPWDLFGFRTAHGRDGKEVVPSQYRYSSVSYSKQRAKALVGSRTQLALQESFRKRYLRLLELNHALMAANVIIEKGGLKAVQLLRFQCLFPRGTPVSTSFGDGVVQRFRPFDGTYEVLLRMGLRDDCTGGYKAYLNSDSIHPLTTNTGDRKSFIRALLGKSAYSHMHTPTLSTSACVRVGRQKQDALSLVARSIHSQKGVAAVPGGGSTEATTWVAWTPYGLARVLEERSADDMVVLKAPWGATLYLSCSCVVKMKEVVLPAATAYEEIHGVVPPAHIPAPAPTRSRGYSFTSPFMSILSPESKASVRPVADSVGTCTATMSSRAVESRGSSSGAKKRSSFWLRMFGYGLMKTIVPPPQATAVEYDIESGNVGRNPTQLECVYSTTGVISMENVEKFLEELENVLSYEVEKCTHDGDGVVAEEWKGVDIAQSDEAPRPPSQVEVDDHCMERFVLHTSYGSGRLLELIDCGDSVLLRVHLSWGAYGSLSISTLQSFTLLNSTGTELNGQVDTWLETLPATQADQACSAKSSYRQGKRECTKDNMTAIKRLHIQLDIVRWLRSRILPSRSRSISAEEQLLDAYCPYGGIPNGKEIK